MGWHRPEWTRTIRFRFVGSLGRLISTGSVRHAYVGLEVAPFPPQATERDGLFVIAATPGGPAAAAGLRAGDVITALDGEPSATPSSST